MRQVVIFGVGSSIAVDIEETCSRLGIVVAAAVSNIEGPSYVSSQLRLVQTADLPEQLLDIDIVLPMFTPGHRRKALEDCLRLGFSRHATLVDPTSAVASSTSLAPGVFVNAGCTIGGATILHRFVFVSRSASIGHHCVVEEFASIGPGCVLAGFVRVGHDSVIGAGAVVLPKVEIGPNAVVGAGSVVTRSVPASCVVVGNPARIVAPRDSETV